MKRAHNISSTHSSNNTNAFQKLSILLQAVTILHFSLGMIFNNTSFFILLLSNSFDK